MGPKVELDALVARPSWAFDDAPSLRTLIGVLKKQLPFMDDKVAVAGHSTGGVILNGLVRHDGVNELVSHAFFIATPFLGAPKTYYAFLKGTMQLGSVEWLILGETELRTLAPNLAVLYYLAPTTAYDNLIGNLVAEDGTPYRYYRAAAHNANTAAFYTFFGLAPPYSDNGSGLSMVMKSVFLQRKLGDAFLSDKSQSWNRTLEHAADAYHAMCRATALGIPEANVRVFYSSHKVDTKPATLGPISYDAHPGVKERLTYQNIDGDGTVPMESLKGQSSAGNLWSDHTLSRVRNDADHVNITNEKEIWTAMQNMVLGR